MAIMKHFTEKKNPVKSTEAENHYTDFGILIIGL
jgi:hypothetical protein